MNTHLTFDDLAIRNETGFFSPEKLTTLKHVIDAVCQEAAIPQGAKAERNALAQRLITASDTMDQEATLLDFARNAVAHYRR